ncbi:MAG: hypothetical protein UZ08_BCD001002707 [Candidatus Parvibacillus calidus]|nr:MAG: hypothetical protein UZ08_BCD001002707 [Candidatus Parvibacillus calidus]
MNIGGNASLYKPDKRTVPRIYTENGGLVARSVTSSSQNQLYQMVIFVL